MVSKNGKAVSYKMKKKYKFDKRDRFKVAVLIDNTETATADDFNKKSAEQTASFKAMQILGIVKQKTAPLWDVRSLRCQKSDAAVVDFWEIDEEIDALCGRVCP